MTKITDMIEKCTISKVGSLNQILPELIETESTYLLPSNVLYNRTSTTTKTRVTIDGSKMGTFVQKGPSLLPKLFDLCLNFRSKPVILTCDIRRMYDSIGLQKSDRPFVRFLHKDLYSENAELEVLEFNSISMGLPDSVFLAIMSLIKIAELIKPLDKNLFEIITTKFYLDDLVAALNCPQEAIELIPKLNNLLKIFGLETHKWQSNSPEVMKSIPMEKRGTEKTFIIKETSELSDMSDTNSEDNMSNNPTRHSVPMIGKSLGMHWSLEENDSYITFEHLNAIAEKIKGKNTLTKRSISAFCGYFFNPLGELSLISITIKVCLKLSWEISIKIGI